MTNRPNNTRAKAGLYMVQHGINGSHLQKINCELLLRLLREEPGHSKASLARRSELSPSTIMRLTGLLESQGYLVETNMVVNNGRGRKGRALALNPTFCSVMGVEVNDLAVSGLTMNFAGEVGTEMEIPLPNKEPDAVLTAIRTVINTLLPKAPAIRRIMIASHGLVDSAHGKLVTFPGNPNWLETDVAGIISKETGIECGVESRVFAALTGELRSGTTPMASNMLYFNSGPGNGFGMPLVINGQVLRGCKGLAGNFGHLHVVADGKQCYCGSYGCLATVATPQAIVDRAKEAINQDVESTLRNYKELTFQIIAKSAKEGDKLSIGLLEEAGRYLGIGFSHVINIINPECIVIGGSLAMSGSLLLDSIKRSARSCTVAQAFNCIRWEISALRWNPAACGAAHLALDPLFIVEG